MGKQPESRIVRRILNHIKDLDDAFAFKVHGSRYMMVGLPDIIVCLAGGFVALEVKVPEERDETSPRQEYVIGLIRQAGGIAEVVCSVDEARSLLNYVRQTLSVES